MSHSIVETVYKTHQVAYREGRYIKIAQAEPAFPFYWEKASAGVLVTAFQPRNSLPALGSARALGLPHHSASWMDWGLTKHYCENGFLMVLPLGPIAKSLRFLTIYHCKCLTYLLASVQFVCIITLFLEGRDLGLLLYKDRFVIYGLYVFVKGSKMGRIFETCFLWI